MGIRHEEMVTALAKPAEQILAECSPQYMHLLHMAVGVAGEVGELYQSTSRENDLEELGDINFYLEGYRQGLEITFEDVMNMVRQLKAGKPFTGDLHTLSCDLLDLTKKLAFYNKDLDKEPLVVMLAKIEIRLTSVYKNKQVSRDESLEANIAKLSERYKGLQYSNEAAQQRADKAPGE